MRLACPLGRQLFFRLQRDAAVADVEDAVGARRLERLTAEDVAVAPEEDHEGLEGLEARPLEQAGPHGEQLDVRRVGEGHHEPAPTGIVDELRQQVGTVGHQAEVGLLARQSGEPDQPLLALGDEELGAAAEARAELADEVDVLRVGLVTDLWRVVVGVADCQDDAAESVARNVGHGMSPEAT